MAQTERMMMNNVEYQCINLYQAVGPGCSNQLQDVMVIQAMLRFIKWGDPSNPFSKQVQYKDFPQVTGIFDNLTKNLIHKYQETGKHFLLKVDGIVEPGKFIRGKDLYRNIDTSKHYRVMTITALNMSCWAMVTPFPFEPSVPGSSGGGMGVTKKINDYIIALKINFPQLSFL